MKTLKEVKAWAKTVVLEYEFLNGLHTLSFIGRPFIGNLTGDRFIAACNTLRAWLEERIRKAGGKVDGDLSGG